MLSAAPLSIPAKKNILAKMKTKADRELLPILIEAALETHHLPINSSKELKILQGFYASYDKNDPMRMAYRQIIETLIRQKGLKEFREALEQKEDKDLAWNSLFIHFMSKELDIRVMTETLVEAGIEEGKIYWRFVRGSKILYSRQDEDRFDYATHPVLRMDWQLFRTFKDSGKRSSPVAIHSALFIEQFTKAQEKEAKEIWEELHTVGILNSAHRLTRGWQAISNTKVVLDSVKKSKQAISYQRIANVLHEIADAPLNAEVITVLPDARIHRRDRNQKKWASTGRLTHSHPTTKASCTKIWDVSTYADLNAHRNTKEEIKEQGIKLNYDHIPSALAMKDKASPSKQAYDEEVRQLETQISNCKEELATFAPKNTALKTRSKLPTVDSEKIANLEEQLAELDQKLEKVIAAFLKESDDKTYTIALGAALHKVGDTFLRSANEQRAEKGNPFLNNIKTYLPILQEGSQKEFVKALGAFRFMYRSQVKKPEAIAGSYTHSQISSSFFTKAGEKKAIDEMIFSALAEVMKRSF